MVRFAAVCLAVMASDLHGQALDPRTYATCPSGLVSSSPATATWRAAWRSIRGCRFYTDNDSFSHGIWAALFTSGQTIVGASLALPITRYNSVKLCFSTGVSTRAGTNFDAA
jgi:hypothetical protein